MTTFKLDGATTFGVAIRHPITHLEVTAEQLYNDASDSMGVVTDYISDLIFDNMDPVPHAMEDALYAEVLAWADIVRTKLRAGGFI